ncbi:MAG: NAD(P)/FAD-dependent oxidoreductase [Actinomycetota bacterium]|nr:NAD(P)/FAD-dependent oxidoreductase [Actinomycetota bacterium]
MNDVLVAGAGPVGLAVAIAAAQAGLQVQVVDPRTTPIDKACGEGLMPEALDRLARLGIDPEGRDFTGIRYIAPGHAALAHFSSGPGRGVRRTVLQAQMQARAEQLGVCFAKGRITELVQGSDSVEVQGFSARYLVGADGLHSQVRSALHIPTTTGPRHRFGIRQHFAVQPWADVVEVYWLPDAELYVTPIDDSTVGVAVLGAAPLDLDDAIARVPALAWRLNLAARVSSPRGAGPMHVHVAQKRVGRALLVGDASGYVDALTGEGLRVGFAQAHAAVACIVANELGGYEREWKRITRSYRILTSSLLLAARNKRMRGTIVPVAQMLPRMFSQIVNLL